jgi:4-amino-4-deoxy-L-arabinose transferase-like glycosyltransferase
MVEQGHWWFQHTPTGKVATKPPLAGWISAALYGGARNWEMAWRLPGFVCALAMLVMLWRAGNRLGVAPLSARPQTPSATCPVRLHLGGLIAVGAFGFNHFSQRLATLVRTDMMLAGFIFFAGYLVYEHVRTAAPWSTRDRWQLFAVVLASMLTKGPIAYAFLLPGLLAFWWIARRRKFANHAWSGWWPWFAPLLVFGAWAGIGIWQSAEFYRQVVMVEFLGRFTVGEAAVHHNQPVYFYLGHLLGKFAPWSAVLLALHFWKPVRAALAQDPARIWLVCWAVGGLVFMSLVPSKRADRIFPVIPPLCLLAAATLVPLLDKRFGRRLTFGTIAAAALITTASAAYSITMDVRGQHDCLVRFGELARRTAAADPSKLAVMNSKDEGLLLYTRQIHFTEPDDALAAWRAGTIDWLILNEADFKKHREKLEPFTKLAEVAKAPEKSSGYVLLERFPAVVR